MVENDVEHGEKSIRSYYPIVVRLAREAFTQLVEEVEAKFPEYNTLRECRRDDHHRLPHTAGLSSTRALDAVHGRTKRTCAAARSPSRWTTVSCGTLELFPHSSSKSKFIFDPLNTSICRKHWSAAQSNVQLFFYFITYTQPLRLATQRPSHADWKSPRPQRRERSRDREPERRHQSPVTMKTKLPDEVMPTLFLTQDEQLSVENEADAMLRDHLDAYRAFVSSGRAFPKDQWKRIKSKEGIDVYRTRKSPSTSATTSTNAASLQRTSSHASSSSSASDLASAAKLERSNPSSSGGASASFSMAISSVHSHTMVSMQQFPVVVLTGIAPGTIEDVAFGVIASTDAMWRLRSTYLNDHHRDCKILATLQRPCKKHPFRSLGVKWAYRKLPSFVQQRDMVYVEKVGATYNADGTIDTLYNLMHSIELPGVPELSQYDILRIKLSLCYVMRQNDDKSIEYYCRAFLVPSGDVPKSIATMIYADALLSTINLVDCAHMKKLMWLTQQQRKRRARTSSSCFQDIENATHCQGCERALKLFGGLSRTVSKCRCCRRIVCGKCSSDRKIVLDVSKDGEVTQKPLAFCVKCVVEARALPALTIAATTAGARYEDW